jgi:hypothetical protein
VKSIAQAGQSKPKIKKSDLPHIRVVVDKLHKNCEDVYKALFLDKLNGINGSTQNTSTDTREAVENFTEAKVC